MAREVVVRASSALTVSGDSGSIQVPPDEPTIRGVVLHLDITAASGTTPTLDITVDRYDHAAAKWVAIPDAAFAQKTTTGQDDLTIYPGVAETANRSVSDVITPVWRAVYAVAGTTPSFTFTLAATYIP